MNKQVCYWRNKKVESLGKLFTARRATGSFQNKNQHENYGQKTSTHIATIDKLVELFKTHNSLSNLKAKYKNTIQKIARIVKSNRDFATIIVPKKPAATSTQNALNTFQNLGEKFRTLTIKVSFLVTLIVILLSTKIQGPAFAQDFPKQDVLDANLHYKDGQVALTSVDKRQGYVPDYLNQPTEGYTLTVFDKKSAQLFQVKFNFPLQVHTDDFSDPANPKGSVETLTEADTTVTIPVFANAQKLQVTEPDGSIVVSHDLSLIVDPNLAKRGATPGFLLDLKPWLIILGILGILALLVAAPTIIRIIRERRSPQT